MAVTYKADIQRKNTFGRYKVSPGFFDFLRRYRKTDSRTELPPKDCREESKPSKGKSRTCKEMVVRQT